MMNYDNLVMPDKARRAARILKQYCQQNGCLYCVFHDKERAGFDPCMLNCQPRNYKISPRSIGGKENA